jgi:hypothetical protein
VLEDSAESIASAILGRLKTDNSDTITSTARFGRDSFVAALCQLNRRFSFWSIRQFIEEVGPFLPAVTDYAEFGDIYPYLCGEFENADDHTKCRIFQIFARLSTVARKLKTMLNENVLTTCDCVMMYQILRMMLEQFEDPQAMISELFGGDQVRIMLFGEFLNNLGLIAQAESQSGQ